jgi:hypothetical protein
MEETPFTPAQGLRRYVALLALGLSVLAIIPAISAWIRAPAEWVYLGHQYNLDDHMVYAAWMHQAMEGRLLFENRFTTDPQPGLTIHLYFLLLGWIAKGIGIPLAMTAARVAFSALFVVLLHRFLKRFELDNFAHKLVLSLTCLGGGVGFLAWETFGLVMVSSSPPGLAQILGHKLPSDVWQPEGFVFPSMLTNSLFMASGCLILYIFTAALRAQTDRHIWWKGALAFLALMNIHSYDVVIIAFTLLGLLTTAISSKSFSKEWLARVLWMAAGALPAAAWFAHVLAQDKVFQARAATPTFSPDLRVLVFGVLPGLLMTGAYLVQNATNPRQKVGGWCLALMPLLLFGAGAVLPLGMKGDESGVANPAVWGVVAVGILVALYMRAEDRPERNLTLAWASFALFLPYFPALFQRKLAMLIAVPFCILGGIQLANILRNHEQTKRNMVTALAILVVAGTSVRWLGRETSLARANVSNTTVHAVYLSRDAAEIMRLIDKIEGEKIIIAPPGIPAKVENAANDFLAPMVSDLNPILVGMSGATAFAGHWSETPKYAERRTLLQKIYYDLSLSSEERKALIAETGATLVVTLDTSSYPGSAPVEVPGKTLYSGTQLNLIQLEK